MRTRPSMAGYSQEAENLIKYYESRSFEDIFSAILHIFPEKPCRILDIGAGTGRHAAALARRGHDVTAVEPTAELREAGQKLHRDVPLTWLDDVLPELETLDGQQYDFVLMAAVIMHFDETERDAILRRVATLLRPGGRLLLSLRHGPIPEGRRMFAVDHESIAAQAKPYGLAYVHHALEPDGAGRPGVNWTMLCMDKAPA